MDEKTRVAGSTTIAPEVIETIIKMTAMETKGVSQVPLQTGHQAVKLKIEDNKVNADVYIRIKHHCNIIEVGKKIQENVNQIITETISMEPGIINIHVEDIDFVADQENIA